jgi:hypothetical protein
MQSSGRGKLPSVDSEPDFAGYNRVFDQLRPRQPVGRLDNPPDQIQRKQHENDDDEDGDDRHGFLPSDLSIELVNLLFAPPALPRQRRS